MNLRYLLGIIIGIIITVTITIWGIKGIPIFALLALRPLILRWKKYKADERERSLFYRTNTIALGFLLALFTFIILSMKDTNTFSITSRLLMIFLGGFIILQGIVGIVLLKNK